MPEHDGKDCMLGQEHEKKIVQLQKDIGEIKGDIKDIKTTLMGRPTWAVTVIITVLSAISVSSLTFALNTLHILASLK